MNKKEKITKEIFRLYKLSDRLNALKNRYENNVERTIRLFLKKKGLEFNNYSDNCIITVGEKEILYTLDGEKMSLKIRNCEHQSPFVKSFVSNIQAKKFESKIQDIKKDFKSKGEIYQVFKDYLIKKSRNIETIYLQKINKKFFNHRIDAEINKYNKLIENEVVKIEIGKTYTENIVAAVGYYRTLERLSYLKLIKKNKKTYQVEYKFENSGKVVNKRVYHEKFKDFFHIDYKRAYEFKDEYKLKSQKT